MLDPNDKKFTDELEAKKIIANRKDRAVNTDKIVSKLDELKPAKIEKTKLDFASALFSLMQGDQGPKGEKGDKGDQGESIKGDQGPKGAVGPKGPKGDKGESIVGPQGPAGTDGVGIEGPAGKDGSSETAQQILDKLNQTTNSLNFSVLRGLDEFQNKINERVNSVSFLPRTLSALYDINFSVAPTDGMALVYNASQNKWVPGSSGGIGSSIIGGIPNSVLYLDSNGNMAQKNPGFTFDGAGSLTIGANIITTNAPVLSLSQTWNASGTTFTAIDLNVTSTAAAAASMLMNLRKGGASIFQVRNDGIVSLASGGEYRTTGGQTVAYTNAGIRAGGTANSVALGYAGSASSFGAEIDANGITVGGGLAGIIQFRTGTASAQQSESARIDVNQNFKLGGTAARATTESTNALVVFDGTAPAGTLANGISLYSTAGVLRVMNAAGVATILSPHDPITGEWIFHSKDTKTGKVLEIAMERLMRALDEKLGGGFIKEFTE